MSLPDRPRRPRSILSAVVTLAAIVTSIAWIAIRGCPRQSGGETPPAPSQVAAAPASTTTDKQPADNPRPSTAPSEVSVVEGTIVYVVDPKRRWRLGRYYIRDAGKGDLSEAVVALRGSKLKEVAKKASPATVSNTVVIDQKDDLFTPETVVLRSGDRVKFTNSDSKLHNVKSIHPLHAFSFNLNQGQEVMQTFDRAVSMRLPVQLGCAYHSSMRAWIYVFDHPFYQLTTGDGKFRLVEVPPGEYRLEVVHPAGRLRWSRRVTIEPGKNLQVDIRLSADDRVK